MSFSEIMLKYCIYRVKKFQSVYSKVLNLGRFPKNKNLQIEPKRCPFYYIVQRRCKYRLKTFHSAEWRNFQSKVYPIIRTLHNWFHVCFIPIFDFSYVSHNIKNYTCTQFCAPWRIEYPTVDQVKTFWLPETAGNHELAFGSDLYSSFSLLCLSPYNVQNKEYLRGWLL